MATVARTPGVVDDVIGFVGGFVVGFVCGVIALAVAAVRSTRPALKPSERIDRVHKAMYGEARSDK